MSAPAVPTEQSAPGSAALWEDFVDVFHAPSRVFERRRAAGFGLALLVLTVLGAALFFAVRPFIQPFFDHQFAMAMEQVRSQPGMTAERFEQMRGTMEKTASFGPIVGALFGTPLAVLLIGVAVFIGARAASVPLSYGQSALIATYSYVPRVLALAAGALLTTLRDPASLPTGLQSFASPAAFLGPDASPLLVALLGRIDLFVLWGTVLIAIGVAVVGRTTRAQGWTAAGIAFALGTLVTLAGALRQIAAAGG